MIYLNQIFELALGTWSLLLLLIENDLWEVPLNGVEFRVILGNTFDFSTGLGFFESTAKMFPSTEFVVDNKMLFSVPLLCHSLLLLTSRRGSVPLSREDSSFFILLLEFKSLVLRGISTLDQALSSFEKAPDFSAERIDGAPSCSCCLNFCSSSLAC